MKFGSPASRCSASWIIPSLPQIKPSLRALHPIKDAYFHQPHLRGKKDYGYQAVEAVLFYNGIILNYAIVMYNKSRSKVKIVQDIAYGIPAPPVVS